MFVFKIIIKKAFKNIKVQNDWTFIEYDFLTLSTKTENICSLKIFKLSVDFKPFNFTNFEVKHSAAI